MKFKKAFTLAEVLITLGIIGVIAALVTPGLIQNYKKRVTVVRMQKFYSDMNQAIRMSEVINGSIEQMPNVEKPFDSKAMIDWWNKYLSKYYTGVKAEEKESGIIVAAKDGSGFGLLASGLSGNISQPCPNASECIHVIFCTEYKYCKDTLDLTQGYDKGFDNIDGKNLFLFHFDTSGLLSYAVGWDGTRAGLIDAGIFGCANRRHIYCARLIQYDGWQIKDDYPVKF